MEPHLPGIWSICRGWYGAVAPATEAVLAFRDNFRGRVRDLAPDQPFGLQFYGLLWRFLLHDLHLDPEAPLPRLVPADVVTLRPPSPDDAQRIQDALALAPPLPRLVYLFWIVTDLDASRLATLMDLPEITVRRARAAVVWHLQQALVR